MAGKMTLLDIRASVIRLLNDYAIAVCNCDESYREQGKHARDCPASPKHVRVRQTARAIARLEELATKGF